VSSEEAHLRRQILRPSPAHRPYFQIRREDVVLEYPQSGRAHPMGSIFAEKTLYGSDAVITNPAKSGRASGSASCGMRTSSCDFIFGAVPSSAVQDRLGIRDRTAVALLLS